MLGEILEKRILQLPAYITYINEANKNRKAMYVSDGFVEIRMKSRRVSFCSLLPGLHILFHSALKGMTLVSPTYYKSARKSKMMSPLPGKPS